MMALRQMLGVIFFAFHVIVPIAAGAGDTDKVVYDSMDTSLPKPAPLVFNVYSC